MRYIYGLLFAVLAGCAAIMPDYEEKTANLDGTDFTVLTYKPPGCAVSGALLLFHGADRSIYNERNDVVPLAQHYCLFVAEALFDENRFPVWRYQHGGIVHQGVVQPSSAWTPRYVIALAAWVRQEEGQPNLPYVQVGHSAGGQFLGRVVAYSPETARHTIIANPSSWVVPSLDVAAPYGFGGVPDAEASLRRYLAAHVSVLVGGADTDSKELEVSLEANKQGLNRYQRAQNVFREAESVARKNGWTFNWTLTIIPNVGHHAMEMLQSDAAFAALHP